MISKDQLVVVIRSAGERTEMVCRELVLREVDEKQVHVVRMIPFEAALIESYRIGIDSGAKWLMTLDADVLLRDCAIRDFLAEAELMSTEHFHLQGLIFDKFLAQYRSAGHRIYRCSMLNYALSMIPGFGEQIRPEGYIVSKMSANGFQTNDSITVFGIHDFEQHYFDIYRKCVVHGFKHRLEIISQLDNWKRSKDPDFRVALMAVIDSVSFYEDVSIDTRIFTQRWGEIINELHIEQKSEILRKDEIEKLVSDVLSNAGNVPESVLNIRSPKKIEYSRKSFLTRLFKEKSFFEALRHIIGHMIVKIGTWIRG